MPNFEFSACFFIRNEIGLCIVCLALPVSQTLLSSSLTKDSRKFTLAAQISLALQSNSYNLYYIPITSKVGWYYDFYGPSTDNKGLHYNPLYILNIFSGIHSVASNYFLIKNFYNTQFSIYLRSAILLIISLWIKYNHNRHCIIFHYAQVKNNGLCVSLNKNELQCQ